MGHAITPWLCVVVLCEHVRLARAWLRSSRCNPLPGLLPLLDDGLHHPHRQNERQDPQHRPLPAAWWDPGSTGEERKLWSLLAFDSVNVSVAGCVVRTLHFTKTNYGRFINCVHFNQRSERDEVIAGWLNTSGATWNVNGEIKCLTLFTSRTSAAIRSQWQIKSLENNRAKV